MEELDYSAFTVRYKNLPDDELLQLLDRKSNLVPAAQAALDHEAATRRTQLAELRRQQAADKVNDDKVALEQFAIRQEKEAREARRWHWYMIALTPLAVWLVVFQAPEEREAGPSTVTLSVVTLYWILVLVRRFRRVKGGEGHSHDT